ncbi:hypothetical protein AMTR_s00093p00053320 [Amborella trichopoda]|uniref:Aminotransferase-like plant mobile domain-containing protein n=1 Tax=Amborella trichopoda TaxID=13333 RepID=W1NU55_AMBTC|nr:hypothetical protein AMTR_s00093p00053320 [Amborella trichopoda]
MEILWLKVTIVAITLRRVENYGEYIVCMKGQLPPGRSHSFIQLTWLRNTFKRLPQNYNRTTLLRYNHAYLLYLVGCTTFADFTYGTIPTIYLQVFEDIEAYEHFKLLRPIPKEIRPGQPKSLRWAPPREWANAHNFGLVIWTPYDDYSDLGEETEEDKDYGLIVHQTTLCRTYLICGHICEGYMPDRDEDAYEELELDDEKEDNVPLVWLPARADEGPSNTQPIPTSV